MNIETVVSLGEEKAKKLISDALLEHLKDGIDANL
jgi:hypothetical protein